MRLEVHQKHITAMLKGGGVQVSKLHSGLVTAGHIAGKQDPEFTLQPPASSQPPAYQSRTCSAWDRGPRSAGSMAPWKS